MTPDPNLVCTRCGFSNVPGDVFCGSCGAFLEWEGQPSEAVPAPHGGVVGAGSTPGAGEDGAPVRATEGATDRDPDVPVIGGPSAASEAPTVAWSPPAATTPTAPGVAGAAGAAGALVRCPACGVANQSARTFCQSCGARLEGTADRLATPSREQIAAAVAAPNRPPARPAGSAAAGARPVEKGQGGAGKWLVLLALVGVLVGVGVVVGSSMLKGSGPASDASTAPGTPGASAAASGIAAASGDLPASGDPGTGGASADPAASAGTGSTGAGEPKALKLLSATASSVVGNLEKFQPGMVIDGDPATSWQEGAKKEKGEWIEVVFDPASVDRVVIRNGYGASTDLFRGNRRLKDVRISVGGGEPVSVRLKDTTKPQAIAVTGAPGATTLRITIVSTYRGIKTAVPKTPFDDAAVSEIRVFGVPGS